MSVGPLVADAKFGLEKLRSKMTAVQRLEMLLMGFLLGSREQVKINAFGNEGRPNQSTAGNVLLGKIFCPKQPQNVTPRKIVIGSSLRVRTIFPSEIHLDVSL